MAKYVLTRYALGEHPRLTLNVDEYTAIRRARDSLGEALAIEERLELVLRNAEEFECDLLAASLRAAFYSDGRGWHSAIGTLQELSRRVLNVLTTTKAYVDQMHGAMSTLYGDGSEREAVKTAFSKEYDTVLGYRTCEALRNHAQHAGESIHGLNSRFAWRDRPTGSRVRVHHMVVTLDSARLLASDAFKRTVANELVAAGETHDLVMFLRQYISCLGRVHVAVRQLMRKDLEAWDALIEEEMQRFLREPSAQGDTTGLAALQHDDKDVVVEVVQVFAKPTERRKALAARNVNPHQLDSIVITSENNPP